MYPWHFGRLPLLLLLLPLPLPLRVTCGLKPPLTPLHPSPLPPGLLCLLLHLCGLCAAVRGRGDVPAGQRGGPALRALPGAGAGTGRAAGALVTQEERRRDGS